MDPKALFKVSYGLYAITSNKGSSINGQIANALIQVTAEPPALAIGLNVKNLTNEFIKESKVFGVSILAQDTPLNFIGQFGFNTTTRSSAALPPRPRRPTGKKKPRQPPCLAISAPFADMSMIRRRAIPMAA
ncbi:MAG: hypothetical protein H6Q45_746 [Deltaproteobacteria bacterium]|nr:hypothetical protein [Deltaproteobacteria bacterium]